MRVLFLIVVILSITRSECATEAGGDAAALRDEASECRYLLMLCEGVRAAATALEQKSTEIPRREKMYKDAKKKSDTAREEFVRMTMRRSFSAPPPEKEIRELAEKQGATEDARLLAKQARNEYDATRLVYRTKLKDVAEAAQVIRAKHETMPDCFLKCSEVLNVEKFR